MIGRLQMALIAAPVIIILCTASLTVKRDVAAGFSAAELEVYRYRSEALLDEIALKVREGLGMMSGLKGPLGASRSLPADSPKSTKKEYVVTFILIGEKERHAIVNGMILKEGDIIDGMKVSRIERARIALVKHGTTVWLKLEEK